MDLSTSDILGLMVAARTDEATTERLQQLHEMLAKIEAAKAENEKIAAACGRDKNEAARLVGVAETRHQNASGKEQKVARDERVLAEVQANIQAEKVAWEKVRQQVDKEQKETKASQLAKDEELSQREQAVAAREADVKAREDAAAALHISATGKIAALHAVLNAP
jgi:hypothetical protein